MNRIHFTVITVVLLLAGCAAAWFLRSDTPAQPAKLHGADAYTGVPFTDTYRNDTYRFSLSIPQNYVVGEMPPDEEGGTAIIIQGEQGKGLQIYITQAASDTETLTEQTIRDAIPGIQVRDPEPIEIAGERRGVAFLSDNEAFGGASREAWFYFRGHLYQISTYEQFDTLLQAMFATWEFF